ncbi:TetR/AcrR family transcriptional regulator [Clostridium cellulovorans]|uniref:Regulatory protein TetR n=1 Tax=Clostridium cellulovorans (strain ATCC 35296 / DSM 3052 / OCM 3 / 743B) TaxID=573061 RepID=D9SNU2_CLOC7|nr:TetR/AcrR family transcriptional regulator [Clostridium cellulovorans]ADL49963.1 regulatory protein TetR [Clostridium cellulovorans 743B]
MIERTNASNIFVCECLQAALLRLLKTKPLENISILELVKIAGVSRNSFYRNYNNLEEIIGEYLMKESQKWWDSYSKSEDKNLTKCLFEHFITLKDIISALYQSNHSHLMMQHIFQCTISGKSCSAQESYQRAIIAGSTWGLFDEWVKRGMKDSPEEMSRFLESGWHERT